MKSFPKVARPTAQRPSHICKGAGLGLIASLVIVLALTAPCFAQDAISFIKLEFPPIAYVQGTAHITTTPPHAHTIIPPAAVWDSAFVIGESAPNSVFLTSPPPTAPPTEHIMAPHSPETVPGPPFPYSLAITVEQFGGIRDLRFRQSNPHGNHEDLHIIALAAFSFFPPPLSELRGYVHGSLGIHLPRPAGSGHGAAAILGGASQVPANESGAVGVMPMIVDLDDQPTFSLLVVVSGITPDQLTAADIHVGAEGTTGPPIVDLGSPAEWRPLPEARGMVRIIGGQLFPPEFLQDLLTGNTYVSLSTLEFPDGEIRGQIEEVTTAPEASPRTPSQ